MFPSLFCCLKFFDFPIGFKISAFLQNKTGMPYSSKIIHPAMASLVADLNELPTNIPSDMSIEPASPEVYWPGLDDISADEEGIVRTVIEGVNDDGEVEGDIVIPGFSDSRLTDRRKELNSDGRLRVLQSLLQRSVNGVLKRKATADVAVQFGLSLRTVQRIWKRARDSGTNVHENYRVKNCGRKRVEIDLELMRSLPLRKRTTMRDLAANLGVSLPFLYRKIKEGIIKRHSNAIKPSLTAENQTARISHCLSSLTPSSLPHDPTFKSMENTVHIDEKWFYLTKKSETYYLFHDEPDLVRFIKSSHFIPKVMFLAAVARPRYGSDGVCTFDGKLGVFPLVQSVAALRSSQNRPRGTLEIKPITNITRDVIRDFMVSKVLPAIANKWPRECSREAIYIQQDNAKTHIHTDDVQFLCAVQESGMNISLVCQPPNSPDLNVLDLGFFRAIPSLQGKDCANSLVELIGAVEQAFQNFEDTKSNNIFLTLQSCMMEILKCDGSNNYKIPHLKKDKLGRQGAICNTLLSRNCCYCGSLPVLIGYQELCDFMSSVFV